MRALRWHGRRDVRLEEVEDAPAPGRGEVRLAVAWCGICGTDLEEFTDGPIIICTEPHPLTGCQAPMIVGHEVSGRVVDVGAEVTSVAPGDLVAVDGIFFCGSCRACRDHRYMLCDTWASIGMTYPGGLAELMTVPAYMAIPAGGEVAADELALAEPFSVAVRALRRGRLSIGERVLVLGGGTIGLATLQVALAGGAGEVHVVDPLPFRRETAASLGAAGAHEPGEVDGGFDLVVDCTGSPATPSVGVHAARSGGRVVLVGIPPEPGPLDFLDLVLREVELIGSLSHIYDEDFVAAVRLISTRRVDPGALITHRLPLERAVDEGIAFLAGPDRGQALKILISPSQG